MIQLSFTKLAVGLGGLALSLTAGAGIATASPNLDSAVNTTCTYDQLVAALNAQNPQFANAFTSSPVMQKGLRDFLAAPPDKRQRTAENMVNTPGAGPYIGALEQTFNTCNNF
ncbi:hemophore-related protein [Mycobacterium sp. 21AC1]|uniref:hemophore-related protein n=1 Tax=[Mycobacterium] appelbergii TaxID=2939269 RepID=UPI002939063B|nr:hemophore-related protein [Mycobacterium sp. 21AC1]MDV3129215.1 hemophore-related protein [Mycobacterium sp. 21AC1]